MLLNFMINLSSCLVFLIFMVTIFTFIDCLTSLRIPEEGMTSINIKQNEYILLEVNNINQLPDNLKHDFLLSIQEVNSRSILFGEKASILLLLCKS
jgi:hypothetical protein